MKNVRLWSPESPFLYDVLYQVLDENGKVIDEVTSYVGMRKVHIEGNKIYLNNKPYYQRLVLDQGFYPDGIWTLRLHVTFCKNGRSLFCATGTTRLY